MNLLKTTWAQLREQRMLSTISIIGTALSIFLIMVVVMWNQVKIVPFAPVSNRERMLHVPFGTIIDNQYDQYQSNGGMSYRSCNALYGELPGAEATTVIGTWMNTSNLQVPGQRPVSGKVRITDEKYWQVFDFTFLSGKPFDKTNVEGIHDVVVIDASTAKKLFGTTDAAGRQVLVDYTPHTVVGVVRDVSELADEAFANVWKPIDPKNSSNWAEGLMGGYGVVILAESRDKFDEIRNACKRSMDAYNKEIENMGWHFIDRKRPYDQEEYTATSGSVAEPDLAGARRNRMMIYVILLLVPAINLSSLTESRLRKRVEELGVRRAFGCTRSQLLSQLFGENLLITIVGGILGLILSVVFAFMFSNFLFGGGGEVAPIIDLNMLVQPSTFVIALLFCFLLNLLSTGIPAWKATRTNIVNALNKH